MGEPLYPGGCLCGKLRFSARAAPSDAGYCHCRICQRCSGAPVLAWAGFPSQSFAYEDGTPAVLASSEFGRREFCNSCGTQLTFRHTQDPSNVWVNVAALDDPAAVKPRYHIWTSSRIPWFETADDLPRYPDAGPDS